MPGAAWGLIMRRKLALFFTLVAAFNSSVTVAVTAPVSDFKEAVTQAVLSNPQVNASWYNFEAVREAERAARGGFLPSVDVTSEIGREDRETPVDLVVGQVREPSRLSITQMLFDGFATREEVRRLG